MRPLDPLCSIVFYVIIVLVLHSGRCAESRLVFDLHSICTYEYELAVHTARGSHSTASTGFHLSALVDIAPVSRDTLVSRDTSSHFMKLTVRQPRIARRRGNHVISRHPINQEFEEQLSKQFYFQQSEHGPISAVYHCGKDKPEIIGIKKGIIGAFQMNLRDLTSPEFKVHEEDDSGTYRANYVLLENNQTHLLFQRKWNNYDYTEFPGEVPVRGEHAHKVKSSYTVHINVLNGKVHKVQRTNKALFQNPKGHPRSENFKGFHANNQDIDISASGYSHLILKSCSKLASHRAARLTEDHHLEGNVIKKSLKRDRLIFTNEDKIKWKSIGGEDKTRRSLYELIRCYSDVLIAEDELAECVNELHYLVNNDKSVFSQIQKLIEERSHQNSTSWMALVNAMSADGGLAAQQVLARALHYDTPRPLTDEERQIVLEAIFFLAKTPLHDCIFRQLVDYVERESRYGDASAMAMWILASVTKRAQLQGFNSSLGDVVFHLIHDSYTNKSVLHRHGTQEHESYLRDHIWGLGNLGHIQGLGIILQHRDHDSSDIRSAAISAMRKLPEHQTNKYLLDAIYNDEENHVKSEAIKVFMERHQGLTEPVVKALEHAMWSAETGDELDSVINEFLENHGKHPKAQHLRKRRNYLIRKKRAFIPALKPWDYSLGPKKQWKKVFGGKWAGAEALVRFLNQIRLRLGLFGGSFEINVDNLALLRAHLLKWGYEIVDGKAAFKVAASFKNDIPNDIIKIVTNFVDKILNSSGSLLDVFINFINKARQKVAKLFPLKTGGLTKFVNNIVEFIRNLFKPVKSGNLISKVIQFAKKVIGKVKSWRNIIDQAKTIQSVIGSESVVGKILDKALNFFDKLKKTVDKVISRLPRGLSNKFRMTDLTKRLTKVDLDSQDKEIDNYFKSIGEKKPQEFSQQMNFREALNLVRNLNAFLKTLTDTIKFGSTFSELMQGFKRLGSLKFPKPRARELKEKFPRDDEGGNKLLPFGISFDWKKRLDLKVDLNSVTFIDFANKLKSVGSFFSQFDEPNFDLNAFFNKIGPGGENDLKVLFPELLKSDRVKRGAQDWPPKIRNFYVFLRNVEALLQQQSSNMLNFTDIAEFFGEIGNNHQKYHWIFKHFCRWAIALPIKSAPFINKFLTRIENVTIVFLKEMDENLFNATSEAGNFTTLIEEFVEELEYNFTVKVREFVSKSLTPLTNKLQGVTKFTDKILDFANGTSEKAAALCRKGANFTTQIIDNVEQWANRAIDELATFIGPVSQKIVKFTNGFKKVITNAEKWYVDNLDDRVGDVSAVADTISKVLTQVKKDNDFTEGLKKILVFIKNGTNELKRVPEHADKARKIADIVAQFAGGAPAIKDKLRDFRKKFVNDWEVKIHTMCSKFREKAQEKLQEFRNVDLADLVNKFLTEQAIKLIKKGIRRLNFLKEPFYKIKEDFRKMAIIGHEMIAFYTNLKPISSNFSPILESLANAPTCHDIETVLRGVGPCWRNARKFVGRVAWKRFRNFLKQLWVLIRMIPRMVGYFVTHVFPDCVKGGPCVQKEFTDQAKNVGKAMKELTTNIQKSQEFSRMKDTCLPIYENYTILEKRVKDLISKVKAFSLKDDVKKIEALVERLNGKEVGDKLKGRKRKKRGFKETKTRFMDKYNKVRKLIKKIQTLVNTNHKALKSAYDNVFAKHEKIFNEVRGQVKQAITIFKDTKDIIPSVYAVQEVVTGATKYADLLKKNIDPLTTPVINFLNGAANISKKISPDLHKFVKVIQKITEKVKLFMEKVTNFLEKIQIRQRELDPKDQRLDLNDYPYCSADVCVRVLRRSSKIYLKYIFTFKYAHLDDLASLTDTGRWVVPGLFDNYKAKGISQLSESLMILSMHGVSTNKDKPSLFVIMNMTNGAVAKIIELSENDAPLTAKIGGVAVVETFVWTGNTEEGKLYGYLKSDVLNSLEQTKPSNVTTASVVNIKVKVTSLSYDLLTNSLWVIDGSEGKAYSFRMASNGDFIGGEAEHERVFTLGKDVRGMTLIRQFGYKYACVSRCALSSGYQCRLEFHNLTTAKKVEIGEKTLRRSVRTPSGLESVQSFEDEHVIIVFSSGTISEKEKYKTTLGDFEDRFFKLKLPILQTNFSVHENCLKLRVLGDWIIKPIRLIPVGKQRCGALRRRRSALEILHEDVYTRALEEEHRRRRVQRDSDGNTEQSKCTSIKEGQLMKPKAYKFFEVRTTIYVFGIPVKLFAGADGHLRVNYYAYMCLKDKQVKAGIIPGAWVSVYAGASVPLIVVEAGVTIEAKILETYLIPTLTAKIDRWPLSACLELKLRMRPLTIRVYLWYRLRTCIKIKCKVLGCKVKITWCKKKTFKEWTWAMQEIERTLFTTCQKDRDVTPPTAGQCHASQSGPQTYVVTWEGFKEDKSIGHYEVAFGRVQGSRELYHSKVGDVLSKQINPLVISHGTAVYPSVWAVNDEGLKSPVATCGVLYAATRGPTISYVYDGKVQRIDADYQSESLFLAVNFEIKIEHQKILQIQWGVSSRGTCTLDASEADVIPLSELGDTTSAVATGLTLQHGKKYYTRVVATSHIGLQTVMCSDGVVIDTTPPIPGQVQDGKGKVDLDFLPSIRRVRATFTNFLDNESPVVQYEWAIIEKGTGEIISPYLKSPLNQRLLLRQQLALKIGVTYQVVVRATNGAGLQTNGKSDGFISDITPPICKSVIDVRNSLETEDVDFVRDLSIVQAKWLCEDDESGIAFQEVAVGRNPYGTDIMPYTNVTDITTLTRYPDGSFFVALTFPKGVIEPKRWYHLTVKAVNKLSMRRTATSDGILNDPSPPSAAPRRVKDGLKSYDLEYSNQQFQYQAHWEGAFTEGESAVTEYRVGLGTVAGLDDAYARESVGLATRVTLTGIMLESGRVYYVNVVACNSVGLCSNGSSDGMLIDFQPPHIGQIINGFKGSTVLYQVLNWAVWARWGWCKVDEERLYENKQASEYQAQPKDYSTCTNDQFFDKGSGIQSFGFSVLSLQSTSLLRPITTAGRVRRFGRRVNMPDGLYSIVVEAKDKAGVTAQAFSETLTVDTSPPMVTHVQYGYEDTIPPNYINERYVQFKGYFETEDDGSGISGYKVGVGTYEGADDALNFKHFKFQQPVSFLKVNWTSSDTVETVNGYMYYITFVAINSAGLTSVNSSTPVLCDTEPPKGGIVLDGWQYGDTNYQTITSMYRVHWYGFTDNFEIADVYIGLTEKRLSPICEVASHQKLTVPTNSYTIDELVLQTGHTYYACIAMVDLANNSAYFWSNGVTIDTTPPRPGYVIDGKVSPGIDFQSQTTRLTANWRNFKEEETRIIYYKLGFGTKPGNDDIQMFIKVGPTTSHPSSRLTVKELTNGQIYYATVIAYNVLGIPSAKVTSTGVMVDGTPPIFTTPVHDGTDSVLDSQAISGDSLSAYWVCTDPESSVMEVKIAFGTEPGESDVMNFTRVSENMTSFTFRLSPKNGVRYFATVTCVNKAGLKTITVSDGVIIDVTPPVVLFIKHERFQKSNTETQVTWRFVDPESPIKCYKISLLKGHNFQNGLVAGPVNVSSEVRRYTIKFENSLSNGLKYYIHISAQNYLGLSSSIISDGFTVDTTPPYCQAVWDGIGSKENDLRFVAHTDRLIVSWKCRDNESMITRYEFSVKDKLSGEILIPFHTTKRNLLNSTNAVVTGNGIQTPKYLNGKKYIVGVRITDAVGHQAVYWTNGVTVDNSPPEIKNIKVIYDPTTSYIILKWNVTDNESGLKSQSWGLGASSGLQDVTPLTRISVSNNMLNVSTNTLTLGKTYYLSLFAENYAGLVSTASSRGFLIDHTPPITGVINSHFVLPDLYNRALNYISNVSIVLAWSGFRDLESGVRDFSWATGISKQVLVTMRTNGYTRVLASESVSGTLLRNLTILSNVTYYVCIRVRNGAGLEATGCSEGMTLILGKFTAGIVSDGPRTYKEDINYQLDDRALWAHWEGFKDPVYGVARYDWCYAAVPINISVQEAKCDTSYTPISYLKTSTHKFHNVSLKHGLKYATTVRAQNTRGETISATSDGFIVDRTPPVKNKLLIGPSKGKQTLYITSASAPTITWQLYDPESGVSLYRIAVGTLASKDDIVTYTPADKLTESLDLDDFNITLTQGFLFFVTVKAVNNLGLEVSVTSQQIVVDWTPPVVGNVMDGNKTVVLDGGHIWPVDVDYQSQTRILSALWSGFYDPESDVKQYHWCIGTATGSCDVSSMTSSELKTSFQYDIPLEDGVTYYVTVKATNGAGTTATAYSDGVTIDTSPPRVGRVIHGAPADDERVDAVTSIHYTKDNQSAYYQAESERIMFHWSYISDDESGVTEASWCAGSLAKSCDLAQWSPLKMRQRFVSYKFPAPFVSGRIIYVTIRAKNGADQITFGTSDPLVVDVTPPSAGTVQVEDVSWVTPSSAGAVQAKYVSRVTYVREDEPIKIIWNNIYDVESNITRFEWKLCQANSMPNCLTQYVSAGSRTSLSKSELGLKPGVSYVIVIRAVNSVGLHTDTTSNVFVMDNSAPTPQRIQLSSRSQFQSSAEEILANWAPFLDPESGIVEYYACVGTKPELCDVKDFKNFGKVLQVQITGLKLNHTSGYYVTVKANNGAGYAALASSDSVTVDSTPPVGGGVRDGESSVDMDVKWDDSFIAGNWDEFTDPESEVTNYQWCAGTTKGVCDVVAETDVGISTRGRKFLSPSLLSGLAVYITVTAVNGAGAKTKVYSDGLTIDTTPPVITTVLDLNQNTSSSDVDYLSDKSLLCASWAPLKDSESSVTKHELAVCTAFDSKNCVQEFTEIRNISIICVSNVDLQEGVKYITKVRATNGVGLSSVSSSDGFILDSSPPIIGEISHKHPPVMIDNEKQFFTQSKISVAWTAFLDKESGIAEYLVCVGTAPGRCDTMSFTSVGRATSYSTTSLALRQKSSYYVSVMAVNGAALRSELATSSGVFVDKTGPEGGSLWDGPRPGVDVKYQQSIDDVHATWDAFDDPESGVVALTWCAGSSPPKCDIAPQAALDVGATFVYHVLQKPMTDGQRCFVTIQATNGAGVVTSLTSSGVVVDSSPPIAGVVIDGEREDSNYLNGHEDIQASWSKFADSETGIQSYAVAVCSAIDQSSCLLTWFSVQNATNISLAGLDFENGQRYAVTVRATNHAGLTRDINSDGFIVDISPPETGRVVVGPSLHRRVIYQSNRTNIQASWDYFVDTESGVTEYKVCIGIAAENCDVKHFVSAGMRTSYDVTGLSLLHNTAYYVTVRATNGAGLLRYAYSESVTTDFSPPEVSNSSLQQNFVKIKCQQELVTMTWKPLADAESGIDRYEVCLGSRQNECNLQPWKSVQQKTFFSKVTQRQNHGTKIYAVVKALNGAGLSTEIAPRGPCLVITEPQRISYFETTHSFMNEAGHMTWQSDGTSMSLRWSISGNSTIPISGLQLGVVGGTQMNQSEAVLFGKAWYGQAVLVDFMDILPWQRDVTIQTPQLVREQNYYGVIKAYIPKGIYAESISEGVIYDPIPPPRRTVDIRDIAAEKEQDRWLPYLRLPKFNQTLINPDVRYISDPSQLVVLIQNPKTHNGSLANYSSSSWNPSKTEGFRIIITRLAARFGYSNATQIKQEVNRFPGLADAAGPCCSNRTSSNITHSFDSHFKTATNVNHFGTSLASLGNDLLAVGAQGKVIIFSLRTRVFLPVDTISPWDVSASNRPDIEILSQDDKAIFFYRGSVSLVQLAPNRSHSVIVTKRTEFSHCKKAFNNVLGEIRNNSSCDRDGSWSDKGKIADAVAFHNNILAISGAIEAGMKGVVGIFIDKGKLGWQFQEQLGRDENVPLFGHSLAMNGQYLAVARGVDNNCTVVVYIKASDSSWKKSREIKLIGYVKMLSPLTIRLTTDNTLVVLSAYSKALIAFKIVSPNNPPLPICKFFSSAGSLSEKIEIREGKTKLVAIGVRTESNMLGVQLLELQAHYMSRDGHVIDNCVQRELLIAHGTTSPSHNDFPILFHGNTILVGTPNVPTWPSSRHRTAGGRVYHVTYCPINHVRKIISNLRGYDLYTCRACKRGYRSLGGMTSFCERCDGRKCSTGEKGTYIEEKLCTNTTCMSTDSGELIAENSERFFAPGSHYTYSAQIIETSRSGVSTTLDTTSFIIDSTLPEMGLVYDGLGTSDSANCSSNETFGEHAQCTSRTLDETDVDYTNNTSEVHARWIDFKDNESDIAEFFWCVGTKPLRDNIRGCESTGLRPNASHYGLSFAHGDSYYVTVVACNSAGRCSAATSDGVTIDTTPPAVEYVRDGVIGPDMDYQVFTDIIFGYWKGSDLDSGVSSYEVAWGTTPGGVDVSDYEEIGNTTIWFTKLEKHRLKKGQKYFATVRAINGAGLLSEPLSSNGIIVGKSEYLFDNTSVSASFFFDTVDVNPDGTREDGGVGATYGTLTVPEGAMNDPVKLRSYSLDKLTLESNRSEEGVVTDPEKTKPKQFMLGNYSFQIKAVDPDNGSIIEGYQFAKPVVITMFFDVDKLVQSNKKVVSGISQQDVRPVLLLWNVHKKSWMDASLTCPEPWSHVNKSAKLLLVRVCHLTQFAFFWSFADQYGLIQLNMTAFGNSSEGFVIERKAQTTELTVEIIRRKGASGNTTVAWSVAANDSYDVSDLLWPSSGSVHFVEGQWEGFVVLTVATYKEKLPDRTAVLRIQNATGGALLAPRDLREVRFMFIGNKKTSPPTPSGVNIVWIVVGVCCALVFILLIGLLVWFLVKKRNKSTKRTVSYHDNVAADNNDAGAAVAELATLSAPEGTVTSIGESPRNERARLTSADTTESGM